MTNEEAIKMLKSKMDGHTDTSYEWVETVRMAVKALEQQQEPSEDCISRQVVKEMLTETWTKYMPMELDINLSFILDKISALPSVTPSYNSVKTELDCISRQAVLEYIEGSGAELGHGSENELVCQDIKNLPSVTPQTRWIPVSERLPKDGQKVLVTTRSGNTIDVDTSIFYHASAFWKHYVIAWMPLPPSYQGESEDKE